VAHLGGELLDRDREVRVLHLPGERLANRGPQATRAVDVPLECGIEKRSEEGQALDVVPVRVADEDVAALGAVTLGQQRLAEAVRARPAVEEDQRPARAAHLDARGVAAIANGAGARLRDRSARAPE